MIKWLIFVWNVLLFYFKLTIASIVLKFAEKDDPTFLEKASNGRILKQVVLVYLFI